MLYSAELSGLVLSEDGEALFYANIKFPADSMYLTADFDGRFLVKGLEKREYNIVFSMVSYKPETITVNIEEDEQYIEVILQEETGEIDIEPKTPKFEMFKGDISLSKWFLYTDDFENQAYFRRDDPIYFARKMPGVISVGKDYAGQPMIRGNGSDKSPILLDDIAIYNPYHFGGFFSGIEPDYVRSINVSTGANDSRYSDWLGGAIRLTTRKPPRESTHGRFRLNPLWANFSLRSPSYIVDGLGFNLAYTGSFPILRKDSTGNKIDYNDLYAKVHFEPNFRWFANVNLYNNFDNIEDEISQMRYTSRAAFINTQNIIGNQLLLKSNIAMSRFCFKYSKFDEVAISDTIQSVDFRTEANYFSGDHDLLLGLKGSFKSLSFMLYDMPESKEFEEFNLYVQDEYFYSDALILKYGTSLGYVTNYEKVTFDPNLAIKYFPNENLGLEFGVGKAHQVITSIWNPDFNFPFDFYIAPKEDISHSYNISASAEQWISDDYSVKLGAFANYAKNISRFPLEGLISSMYYYPGDSRAKGIELMMKKSSGKFRGFITYTLMDADEIFEYTFQNPEWESSRFERKNSLYITASYRFKRFDIGTSLDYGSGIPTEFEEKERAPDLLSWDLRMHGKINLWGLKLNPYLEIYNLTGHENIIYIDKDGNETKAIDIPFMLGIEGRF